MFEDVDEVKKDGEQPLKFLYNREERIAKASRQVQEYYNGGMRPVRGIKSLFYKGNKYILFALLFFVSTVWGYNALHKNKAYTKITDIYFDCEAYSLKNEVYANIKIHNSKRSPNSNPVNIIAHIDFYNAQDEIVDYSDFSLFYSSGEHYLRTKIDDYDIIKASFTLKALDETKEVFTGVLKK